MKKHLSYLPAQTSSHGAENTAVMPASFNRQKAETHIGSIMKRAAALLLIVFLGIGVTAYAGGDKEQKRYAKEAEKLAKKRAKELKKEKWVFNGANTLENALENYYLETEPSCGGDKESRSYDINNAKSIPLGEKRMLMNAQTEYIQEIKTAISGSIADHNAQTNDEQLEAYVSDVEARIAGELKGDVKRAFTLYKQNKNGTFLVRGFFIIDSNSTARKLDRYADQFQKDEDIANAIRKAARGEK